MALHKLPNEILIKIAGYSSDSTRLALRGVSKHLQEIAQTKTSATQNFIFAKGAALQEMGHDVIDMWILAARPAAQQNFVLKHGADLKTLGYDAGDMHDLARRSPAEQDLVLANRTPL
jgi:hypothetical protein